MDQPANRAGAQNRTSLERKGDRELVVTRTFDAPPSMVYRAWSQPELEGFRRFAVLPALDEVIASGDEVCAFFVDLRFTVPGLKPPFRYGACHSPAGWRLSEPSGNTFPEAVSSNS